MNKQNVKTAAPPIIIARLVRQELVGQDAARHRYSQVPKIEESSGDHSSTKHEKVVGTPNPADNVVSQSASKVR